MVDALTGASPCDKVHQSAKKCRIVPDIVFQGTSALTLDGKGRISVPSRHRDVLATLTNSELTLTKHPVGCLLVFPRPAWLNFREKLLGLPMNADGWRRVFLGSAIDVEVDGGSRLLIPPELRSAAGLVRDVLLLGMGQRLELWDAARHAVHEQQVMAGPMPDAIQDFVF